jgi:hypothetical protein
VPEDRVVLNLADALLLEGVRVTKCCILDRDLRGSSNCLLLFGVVKQG